ncbi:MAG: serine/threonine-protein kinase [Methylococcaceae bacterium]|nr:serine/threonine-protein kinase [Methylococcaceae bacterium]
MTTNPEDKTQVMEGKTVLPQSEPTHLCPACGAANALVELPRREYRCSRCKLELAHLDYAVNGTVRGVFGWLLPAGDVVLDRYQIKSVLGKGGFGAAYLVDDLQLSGKRRALKEVPEMLFDEYETTLLSRLDHPAIPDIIERKAVNHMVYLVLKFGGNRTLGSERKQYPDKRIPQDKLFPWMRQLCEVLSYLHGQNPPIIHRDLKPDNILLNEDDRIMLIDFGIAKEAVPQAMTRTLGRAATHGFSPPEQVMGTGTDERSDIYALGATFYALLTGQNPPAAHERVAGAELVPPSHIVPDVSPELEDAILQSLSLNVHHRQQTVQEFALALEGEEMGTASHPIRTEAQGERTVVASRATEGAYSKPTGLKLPTARQTAGRQTAMPTPEPIPQGNKLLPLLGIAVVLAAIATGLYLYFSRSQTPIQVSQPAIPPPVVPTPPPIPAETPPPSPPVANIPPPASPPVQPAVPATPAVTPPKAATEGGGGSAQEMLKGRAVEPEPPAPVVSASPPPKPKPKPRPKAVVHAPAERSSPPPARAAEPSWTIIPGGAHKTD